MPSGLPCHQRSRWHRGQLVLYLDLALCSEGDRMVLNADLSFAQLEGHEESRMQSNALKCTCACARTEVYILEQLSKY